MIFRIVNRETGTDLGDYEAASKDDALASFLADTEDETLDPYVEADPMP